MVKKLILILVGMIGFCAPSFADEYYVEPASHTGLSQSIATTVTELVQSYVTDENQDLVSSPDDADYTLRPKVLKLGSAIVLKMSKIQGKKVIYSSRLKAGTVEDLDNVAARLTRAVILETHPKGDTRVGEVTREEATRESHRKQTQKRWYVGIGPALSGKLETDDILYNFNIAYGFDFTQIQALFFLDVAAGEGSAIYQDLGLGVHYYFSNRNTSPFVGADLGYGNTKTAGTLFTGDSTSGFVIGARGGITFMRTSSVNLEISGRASILLDKNRNGNPLLWSMRLGIYF